MDLILIGLLVLTGGAFTFGMGVGGWLTVIRINAHNAAFLDDEEKELGI